MEIDPIIRRAIKTPRKLPFPPPTATPPSTTIVSTSSSAPSPYSGLPEPSYDIRTSPAKAAKNPEITYVIIFIRSTFMPARRARFSFPPIV